jgi:hypothetical protein
MARNAHRNDDKKRRACRDDRPIDVDAVGSGAVADLTAIGFWPVRRQVRFPVTILIITALAFSPRAVPSSGASIVPATTTPRTGYFGPLFSDSALLASLSVFSM